MSITVIKPPACKNCEHWIPKLMRCDLAGAEHPDLIGDMIRNDTGFMPEAYGTDAHLTTGANFYCCHFKQKEGE